MMFWDFPGGESACQCRGYGLKPWSGKIPHATEQLRPQLLSLRSRARVPQLLSLRVATTEAHTPRARALQ